MKMTMLMLVMTLGYPSLCSGAIAFDTVVASSQTSTTSPLEIDITVASGSDLYAILGCTAVNVTITSTTFDGSAMTLEETFVNGIYVIYLYGLADPGSGAKHATVNYSAGSDTNINCHLLTFSGAGSVGVSTSTKEVDGDTGNITATATTESADSWTVELTFVLDAFTPTAQSGQTVRSTLINTSEGVGSASGTEALGAAGSTAVTWGVNWNQAMLAWLELEEAVDGGGGGETGSTGSIILTPGQGSLSTSPGKGRITFN